MSFKMGMSYILDSMCREPMWFSFFRFATGSAGAIITLFIEVTLQCDLLELMLSY